jgi:hypothetical protein
MTDISGMQITLQTPKAEPQREKCSDDNKNYMERFQ